MVHTARDEPQGADRKERQRHDVFYLGGGGSAKRSTSAAAAVESASEVDEIPIAKLDLTSGLLDIPLP